VISTGSIGLDVALGIGGVPRGRITEIYGPESSGKTTLALHVIAEAQRKGGIAAFIDAEHALDAHYASRYVARINDPSQSLSLCVCVCRSLTCRVQLLNRSIGVKIDQLLVSQPDCGEQALDIAEALVRQNKVDVVVIDSVAALVPKAELDGEMGDAHMGLQARLMSQAMRKLTGALANSNVVLVFINQIRMKIGVMFGSPEVTSGGNALKFYSSVRLDVRKVAQLKRGDEHVGTQVRVTVKKNKMAPPFREALFDIDFGTGISRTGELVDLGLTCNVLEKSGSWYAYGDKQLGQGRDKAKTTLLEDAALATEIEDKIRNTLLKPASADTHEIAAEPLGGSSDDDDNNNDDSEITSLEHEVARDTEASSDNKQL
jgi:recombination protein RecA